MDFEARLVQRTTNRRGRVARRDEGRSRGSWLTEERRQSTNSGKTTESSGTRRVVSPVNFVELAIWKLWSAILRPRNAPGSATDRRLFLACWKYLTRVSASRGVKTEAKERKGACSRPYETNGPVKSL